jgi:hypothetical protein
MASKRELPDVEIGAGARERIGVVFDEIEFLARAGGRGGSGGGRRRDERAGGDPPCDLDTEIERREAVACSDVFHQARRALIIADAEIFQERLRDRINQADVGGGDTAAKKCGPHFAVDGGFRERVGQSVADVKLGQVLCGREGDGQRRQQEKP